MAYASGLTLGLLRRLKCHYHQSFLLLVFNTHIFVARWAFDCNVCKVSSLLCACQLARHFHFDCGNPFSILLVYVYTSVCVSTHIDDNCVGWLFHAFLCVCGFFLCFLVNACLYFVFADDRRHNVVNSYLINRYVVYSGKGI